jgi:MFS family permease
MVLEPVTREFGIGRGAGALPYTMYMIGFGLGNILLGQVLDRFGIAVLALIGSISLPGGLLIASSTHDLWLFIFTLSVLCGFMGGAFAFGPLVADISHWFSNRRGLAVGIVISGSYVGGALWPPILQNWIDTVGWRECFVNLAIICGVTMIPLSFVYFRKNNVDLEIESGSLDRDWEQPLGMPKKRLQGMLCFAGIGCCVAMAMPQIHIVPHAIDLGFRPRDGADMLSLMLGSGIISRIASGWISDRIGGLKTLLLGYTWFQLLSGLPRAELSLLTRLSQENFSGAGKQAKELAWHSWPQPGEWRLAGGWRVSCTTFPVPIPCLS